MKCTEFSRATAAFAVLLSWVVVSAGASSAWAAVPVNFSGGSGSPLSMTLPEPVTYTITADFDPFFGPFFVFDGTGDVLGTSFPNVTGTITWSIDGGGPIALDAMNSGVFVDSISGDDLYTVGPTGPLAIGAVITLSAGTLTTTTNVAAAAPASGNYETWITASNGYTISTFGAFGVPEPASIGLLGFAGLGLVCRRRSRSN